MINLRGVKGIFFLEFWLIAFNMSTKCTKFSSQSLTISSSNFLSHLFSLVVVAIAKEKAESFFFCITSFLSIEKFSSSPRASVCGSIDQWKLMRITLNQNSIMFYYVTFMSNVHWCCLSFFFNLRQNDFNSHMRW